ncbi:DUF2164 family protein [Desulfitobacterium metallireducens]|uniref:DUF2164 domain-containing protein n=1 Tax=Desulfitobacterium metallireducens DSM 15288 TaxID=871968 RepID=W0E6C3_9FIRM|nr:DUF2164 family protein [Desulfitobacterium metallireducens]AHF06425.1 hypothetical protein DESME_04635 [Desulfitobacterium metallireducens DSM 15288]
MKQKLKLDKEKRQEMIRTLQVYFLNEREEELGDLAADLLLEFIIDKLAFEFYNQGVYDSYKFMSERTEDLLGIIKYE